MKNAKYNANTFKLHHPTVYYLYDLVNDVSGIDDLPIECILPYIIATAHANNYVLSNALCDIIIHQESETLFYEAQSRKLLDERAYIKLLSSGFSSPPEIELFLCYLLTRCFRDDSSSVRSSIVDAMSLNGGTDSLQLLQEVSYELDSSIISLELDSESMITSPIQDKCILMMVKIESSTIFLTQVNKAIRKITDRVNNSSAATGLSAGDS
jgi:hypothetical protein